MKDFTQENWYLQYNSDITEDIFNKIISTLISKGFSPFIHCGFKHEYYQFKNSGYIRSYLGEGELSGTENPNFTYFCIDNNDQGIDNEIFVDDILNLEINPTYEIY